MEKYDVIIIGAGAAGMSAACELSRKRKKILVLEARDRTGGRIHSINEPAFPGVIEAGAEFIHGKLPETLRLLAQAGIITEKVGGTIFKVKQGVVHKTDQFIEGWEHLAQKMKEVHQDIPIAEFLNKFFPGEIHNELRETVSNYVEGYDAADVNRASTISLRKEWEGEEEDEERVSTGYGALINFLTNESKKLNSELLLSTPAEEVIWSPNHVEVRTGKESFYSGKVLITLPLSLWQAKKETKGYISYTPELVAKEDAALRMGYGSVIKIILLFDKMFWEHDVPNKMNNAGFIFSDAEIPTWWTQHPRKTPILTGWLGGPKSTGIQYQDESIVLRKAIESLAYIFDVTPGYVSQRLQAHKIFNWAQEPFSLGAYSYATTETLQAKKVMSEPIENTLFFAGEALSEGSETGTVEAALVSGITVAKQINSNDSI